MKKSEKNKKTNKPMIIRKTICFDESLYQAFAEAALADKRKFSPFVTNYLGNHLPENKS